MDKTIRLFIVLEELKRCYIKHVNNREVVSCIQQLVDGYFEICDIESTCKCLVYVNENGLYEKQINNNFTNNIYGTVIFGCINHEGEPCDFDDNELEYLYKRFNI